MKKQRHCILLIILIISSMFSSFSFSAVRVNGYTRSDGTYVAPYYRTAPNSTINDNYSTYPNINPYTGKQGTIPPEYGSYYVAPSTSWTSTNYLSAPKYYVGQSIYTKIPTYKVIVNGIEIDSQLSEYPLLVYNGITYFPMTFHYAQALGLTTSWNQTSGFGISKSSQTVNSIFSPRNGGTYSKSSTYKATIPSFKIRVNGKEINNQYEEYPLLVFRDITYFPMTWRFAVTEFGLKTKWDNIDGYSITCPMTETATSVPVNSTETAQNNSAVNNVPLISEPEIDLEYEIFQLLLLNLKSYENPLKVELIGLNAPYVPGENFVLLNLKYPEGIETKTQWFFLILSDFTLEEEYSFAKGDLYEYILEEEQTVYPGAIDAEKVNSMLQKYFSEIRF